MEEAILRNKEQFDNICKKMKKLLACKQKLKMQHPIQVVPRIYIGNLYHALKNPQLHRFGLIISCVPIEEEDRKSGIKYVILPIRDSSNQSIIQYFEQVREAIESLQDIESAVLVNCFKGKSRSVALVCSYLMSTMGVGFEQSLKMVKSVHHQAEPNENFCRQLKEYEQMLSDSGAGHRKIQSMGGEEKAKQSSPQEKECKNGDGEIESIHELGSAVFESEGEIRAPKKQEEEQQQIQQKQQKQEVKQQRAQQQQQKEQTQQSEEIMKERTAGTVEQREESNGSQKQTQPKQEQQGARKTEQENEQKQQEGPQEDNTNEPQEGVPHLQKRSKKNKKSKQSKRKN